MDNQENIKITAAIPGDGEGVAAVHKTTWLATYPNAAAGITKEDVLSMVGFFDRPQNIGEWEEKISDNGKKDYYICVAKVNARVVAFCAAKKFETYNQLSALYIDPEYQKRGIGRLLFAQIISWLGCKKRLIVTPVEYNEPAVRFYEKIGFVKVPDKRTYKQIPSGKTMPIIEMEIAPINKKFLITDIDGTVFDRIPMFCDAFVSLLQKEGVPDFAAKNYYYGSQGKPVSEQFGFVLDHFKKNGPGKVGRLVDDFWPAVSSLDFNLFPGVASALARAKNMGLELLASSGSKTAELEGLAKKFSLPYDIILGGDKIAKGDAHIEFFASRLKVDVQEFCHDAVFVGDGTVDMEIASRHGIFAVGVTNTLPAARLIAAGASVAVRRFDEVLDFVGGG